MTTQERINNYYQVSCNDSTCYPMLQGEQTADVVIIGGGSTGVATAVELSEKGFKVAVVEAHRVGWGASGRNGGQVTGSLSGDKAIFKQLYREIGSDALNVIRMLRWQGHDIIRERVNKYHIHCDLRHGHLHTAYTKQDIPDLIVAMEDAIEAGLDTDVCWLTKEQVQEKLGTPLYFGGVLNQRNFHLHSLNLCLGEARAAVSLGASIFEQSKVTSIRYGKRPVVKTTHGSIHCNSVVIAGNAYHRLAQHKLRGLVFPAVLGNLATAPLSDLQLKTVNPDNLAVYDSRMVLDYYRLTADNRLLFGGGTNYSGREMTNVAGSLRPALEKTFPQLAGIAIDYAWTGTAGIVVNRIPALGRIEGNVYYAQGYSGHGIASSHIMARIMADALAGTLEDFDLFSRLNHIRIPVTPRIGSALVALGMTYYHLKQSLQTPK